MGLQCQIFWDETFPHFLMDCPVNGFDYSMVLIIEEHRTSSNQILEKLRERRKTLVSWVGLWENIWSRSIQKRMQVYQTLRHGAGHSDTSVHFQLPIYGKETNKNFDKWYSKLLQISRERCFDTTQIPRSLTTLQIYKTDDLFSSNLERLWHCTTGSHSYL